VALPFAKRRMTPEQLEMVRSRERTARSAVFAAQACFVVTCLLIVLAAVAIWWYSAADIRAATGHAYYPALVAYIIAVRLIGQPIYRPMRRRTRNVVARQTGDLISGDALVYKVTVERALRSGSRRGIEYRKLELAGGGAILVRGPAVERAEAAESFPSREQEIVVAPRSRQILDMTCSGDRLPVVTADAAWDDVRQAVGDALLEPEFVML